MLWMGLNGQRLPTATGRPQPASNTAVLYFRSKTAVSGSFRAFAAPQSGGFPRP